MALVLKDRVKETTTTTSTGTYTLGGAQVGYQSFSVVGNGNSTYYTVTDGTNWEVGVGTYTSSGTLLSRDTILESSNGGSAVNWGVGSKDVFLTYPAERAVLVDNNSEIVPATSASLVGNTTTIQLRNSSTPGSVPTALSLSAGELVVNTADGKLYFLDSGGTVKVLSQANQIAPLTTKGDLLVNDGTSNVRLPVGTNTYVLTADSAEATGVKWAAGGGGISSADIQEFTSSGTSTWTKPAGAKMVYVLLYGGGGGGGSGRKRSSSGLATAAAGGGAGGAGGRTELWIPASALGSTVTVTVGAGGTGGAANTTNDTNGIAGSGQTNSSFGSFALARAGSSGSGGSTSTGSGASSGGGLAETTSSSSLYTSDGGSGSTIIGSNGSRGGYKSGGGAGGGGFTASSTTERSGGTGGLGGSLFDTSTTSTTGGGTAGNTSGAPNGGPGAAASSYFVGGSGGGGGASSGTTAGNGGAGGYPAGGGGGGGAGYTVNSGAGGNGGNGYVRVVTFF
jgi:hypothetical protein